MRANLATFGPKGGFSPGAHVGLNTLAGLAAANHPNPVAALRAFSPLPRDSQEIIDGEIIKVGRDNLIVAADLLDSGLTKALPNWLSLTTYTAQKAGEGGRAQVGMTPNTRGERQVLDLGEFSVPIFCIWDDWEFDARTLATAARVGYPIDTTMAEQATRNVNEKIEDVVLNGLVDANGDLVKVYDLPVRGLLNAPNVNEFTFAGGVSWDASAKTGSDILADLNDMVALGEAAKYNGPWTIYVPRSFGFKFSLEYTANYPVTILSRLQQLPGIAAIKVAPSLPDDTVLMLQKTSNVFDLLVGMLPTNFSWQTNPGMPYSGVSSMVVAVVIPRPKSDYNSQSGIVVGKTTWA